MFKLMGKKIIKILRKYSFSIWTYEFTNKKIEQIQLALVKFLYCTNHVSIFFIIIFFLNPHLTHLSRMGFPIPFPF